MKVFLSNIEDQFQKFYQIQEKLKESTFSFIHKCWSIDHEKVYSAKIIKNHKNYFDQGL